MHRSICIAALLLAANPLSAQLSETGILLDRIVAVVNEGVVLQSELELQLDAIRTGLSAQGVALPSDEILRSQVLESLVLKRIQLQRADRIGLTISDEELNRSLAGLAERNGISLSQLPAALASQGIDYTMYRNEARSEMILEQLRMRDVASRISISLNEVDQLVAKSSPNEQDYEVLHILVAVNGSADSATIAEAEEKANDIYQRIVNGEEFGPMAISYSDAPGVLQNRGSLGYRKGSELPSLFADQVLTMEKGETAKPIRSSSGFHIIQLNDVRGTEKVMINQRRARHILIQPNEVLTEDEARAKLEDILTRLEAGEDFAALAEAESDDLSTAKRGGDLGWSNPETFVPAFEAQLNSLQPGQISKPFRSEFGWHIVEYLEQREHDSTTEVRRNQAAARLRARKFEEEAQLWLRQLRDEAYVEIRLDPGNS